MVYFICVFVFALPIIAKFADGLAGKRHAKPLNPLYFFLVALNFSVVPPVSANYANFAFYVGFVHALTFGLIAGFAARLAALLAQARRVYGANGFSRLCAATAKRALFESIPTIATAPLFVLIGCFSSYKFGDTGAYINISEYFKLGAFSLRAGDGVFYPSGLSLTSILGPYQYSAVYYVYAAWSVHGSVVPFYTILSPLFLWVLASHAINETVLLFCGKRRHFVWVSLAILGFCLFLCVFSYYWMSASNNSHFEMLFMLLAYEIINSAKKKAGVSQTFYPLFGLCFFSVTGYLFFVPLGAVFVAWSVYRMDRKMFAHNLIFLVCSGAMYVFLLEFAWIGVVGMFLVYLECVFLTILLWKRIDALWSRASAFLRWDAAKSRLSARRRAIVGFRRPPWWANYAFKAAALAAFAVLGFVIAYANYEYFRISVLRILLLLICCAWLLLCDRGFAKNRKWFDFALFVFLLWFASESIAFLSTKVTYNSSAWRFLYLSGDFWMTLIPYVYVLTVFTFVLTRCEYPKTPNGRINLKFWSVLAVMVADLAVVLIILYIRVPELPGLGAYFSWDVFRNLFVWDWSPAALVPALPA